MTDLESDILRILKKCKGKARALKAKTIAKMIGGNTTEREVRIGIKALIEVYHIAIASTIEPPYGFYMPETIEECTEYAGTLKHRLRGTRERLEAFEAAAIGRFGKQGRLGL